MQCKEIIHTIEEKYPVRFALEWDNVGLLVGRDDKEVKRIYIALDGTDEVIDEAVRRRADLLITHHPLIFGGMKRINNQDFTGKRILKLIQNDICCYAMHTNYDVCGMGYLAAQRMGMKNSEVLEVTKDEEMPAGIGEIADLEREVSLKEYAVRVKEAFELENVKIFGNLDKKIKRAALCPGSGKSVIAQALQKGADVLVTGDIGHHEGIDALAQGMAVIDAGHYGMEHIFVEDMTKFLQEQIPGAEVTGAPVKHPFCVI